MAKYEKQGQKNLYLNEREMNYQVKSNYREIDNNDWDEFVTKHAQGNVFQSQIMYQLYEQTVNYKPVVIFVHDELKKLAGIILAVIQKEKRGMTGYPTARTIVWGGPLISDVEQEAKNQICDLLIKSLVSQVKGKTIYIQFRNLFDLSEFTSVFVKNNFKFNAHLNYHVKIDSQNSVKKKLSKSKIRQINKSLKTGAEIVEPANIDEVRKYYRLLTYLYKKKVKLPLADWSLFENFYIMGQQKNIGKYFFIKYLGEIIGGIMCPISDNKIIYEWYICGLDGKYNNIYPSILATWAPIEYALKHNLQYFDFMGAGKPDSDYGVREFKSKFGGELVNFGRFERINNRFIYSVGKLAVKIFKKI